MDITRKEIWAIIANPTTPPLLKAVAEKCEELWHENGKINNERNIFRGYLLSNANNARKAIEKVEMNPKERPDGVSAPQYRTPQELAELVKRMFQMQTDPVIINPPFETK